MAALSIPAQFVADLLGAESPEERDLAEKLALALQKIDPALLPQALDHPYADAILEGIDAFEWLPPAYDKASAEGEKAAIVDAVAEIIQRSWATGTVVDWLQKVMAETKSPMVASMAARALALAGEDGFLEQQRHFLASEDPSEIRVSAKLLGYGRYQPAVPDLLNRLSADNMAAADPIIWALGEIGDEAALGKLHAMVEKGVETALVCEALGKIGNRSSILRVLPVLLEAPEPQREVAARALAEIIRKSGGELGDKNLVRTVVDAVNKLIDKDKSPKVRFWSMLAYAYLDGHLEPNRILTALGGGLSEREARRLETTLKKKPAPAAKKPKKLI